MKELLEGLKRVIAYESVENEAQDGRPFGTAVFDCLEEVLSQARALGMKTVNMDGYCGYAEVGEGELVGILGHLDVVPVGDGWDSPPFELTERGGAIYGRGVMDNKGPTLANLYAVGELLKEGKVPKKRIRLIFGCNEESGMKCIEYYKAHAEIPSLAYAPDAEFPLVATEKGIADIKAYVAKPQGLLSISGGQRRNMVADKCTARIEKSAIKDISAASECKVDDGGDSYILSAVGLAAHGSTPDNGVNAIKKVLSDLYAITGEEFYDMLFNKCATDGSGIGMKFADFSGACTFNIGRIDTNGDKLKLYLDMRYPVTVPPERVQRAIDGISADNNIRFNAPLNVPHENYLVKTLLSVYNEMTGEDGKPLAIGGGTYARALPCTAVAFGPVFPHEDYNLHRANEGVSLESFQKAYEIYKRAISILCF